MYDKEIRKVYKYIINSSKKYISTTLEKEKEIDFYKYSLLQLDDLIKEVEPLTYNEFKDRYVFAICIFAIDYGLTRGKIEKNKREEIITKMVEISLDNYPSFIRYAMGRQMISKGKREMYKNISKQISNGKINKIDYRISFKEDSETKFRVRYFECAALKLAKIIGIGEESFPCICKLDFIIAEKLGYNLKRVTTLADGFECCEFCYENISKKGK